MKSYTKRLPGVNLICNDPNNHKTLFCIIGVGSTKTGDKLQLRLCVFHICTTPVHVRTHATDCKSTYIIKPTLSDVHLCLNLLINCYAVTILLLLLYSEHCANKYFHVSIIIQKLYWRQQKPPISLVDVPRFRNKYLWQKQRLFYSGLIGYGQPTRLYMYMQL